MFGDFAIVKSFDNSKHQQTPKMSFVMSFDSKHYKLKTKDILKQRLTDCFQQECDAFLHYPQNAF